MPTIIQQASGTFNGTSIVCALPGASSSANRVVVVITGSVTVTTLAGFTLRTSQVNYMGHYLYDRLGGSTSYTFTCANGPGNWYIVELEGAAFDTAFSQNDAIPYNTVYDSGAVIPAAGNKIIIASLGNILTGLARTTADWTNSFIERADTCVAIGDFPLGAVATLETVADGTTSYTTSATFTSASNGSSGLMAAYTVAGPAIASVPTSAAGTVAATGSPRPAATAARTSESTMGIAATPRITRPVSTSASASSSSSSPQAVPVSATGSLSGAATPRVPGTVPLSSGGTLAASGALGNVPFSIWESPGSETVLVMEGIWDGVVVRPSLASIYQVNFFANSNAVGTLQAIGTARLGITNTVASTASGSLAVSGGAPLRTPASILNIGNNLGQNHFELEFSRVGASALAQVSGELVRTGFKEDPYFIAAASSGVKVQMQAPIAGPSPAGSTFAHAELRELTQNGAFQMTFDVTTGDHQVRARHTITHLAPGRSEVIVGQLHDGASERVSIRTQVVGGVTQLRVRVNGTIVGLPVLANPYVLGTEFEWMIKVVSGGAVQIFYNDMVTPVHTTAPMPQTAGLTTWYFKVGCSNQSDTSTDVGTEYFSVEIRHLRHLHTAWAAPDPFPDIPAFISASADAVGTLSLGTRKPAIVASTVPRTASGDLVAAGQIPGGVLPGWLRTPSNTGIAAKGLVDANLTNYGPINADLLITTPQYRKIFNMGPYQMIMTGPSATLTECVVITNHIAHGCIQLADAGGQQIVNCDVRCTGGATGGEQIAIKTWAEAKNTLFHSVKITGATIAIWHDSDQVNGNGSVISEIYAYNFLPETGNQQHRDGFTRRSGSSPLLLRDSWFQMTEVGVGSFVTAAFFIQPTSGVVGRVDAQNCYFSGDGYNSFIQTSNNITTNNCRFKTTEWAARGGDGVHTNEIWTNNFLFANTPPLYRGSPVN